jgi:hypothetical protein
MANLLDGMSKSFNAVESGDIDHGRRRFVEGVAISAAAAATLSFLPKHAASLPQPKTAQSARSVSTFRKISLSICAGASAPRAGPTARR